MTSNSDISRVNFTDIRNKNIPKTLIIFIPGTKKKRRNVIEKKNRTQKQCTAYTHDYPTVKQSDENVE